MQYLVIFEKAADGTVWAKVPDLDGCYSSGDTINEAKENVRDAIALYLKDLREERKRVPESRLLKAEISCCLVCSHWIFSKTALFFK